MLNNKMLNADMKNTFFNRLKKIYAAMDEGYNKVAEGYGFDCRGCQDNCCMTRFYHHTYLEYFYLIEGFRTLADAIQKTAVEKAENIRAEMQRSDNDGEPFRFMCPLNMDGLCILYAYRPMICRLHGIPHELRKPGQTPVMGPGCEAFVSQCKDMAYIRFDRTPFYVEMSKAEYELKLAAGLQEKFRYTIAEMLLL